MPLVPVASTRLLTLINQANPNLPVPVAENNLYFGNARLQASSTDGVSSIVPTVGVLGSVYSGYEDFTYRRINLSTAYDQIPLMKSVGASTVYDMLDTINQFLGLNLTEQDVVDSPVATVQTGATVNINLQAKPGSLGYTGALILEFNRVRPQLTDVLRDQELDVLAYEVDPTLVKRDIAMQMWNVDMSPFNLQPLVGAGGIWKNSATIKAVIQEQFGYTDWPTATSQQVIDYATSKYPGSNTSFQRVIVQTGVVGAGYIGTALFHYNPL